MRLSIYVHTYSCAPAAFSSRLWVEGFGFRSRPTLHIHVKGDKERQSEGGMRKNERGQKGGKQLRPAHVPRFASGIVRCSSTPLRRSVCVWLAVCFCVDVCVHELKGRPHRSLARAHTLVSRAHTHSESDSPAVFTLVVVGASGSPPLRISGQGADRAAAVVAHPAVGGHDHPCPLSLGPGCPRIRTHPGRS